MPAAKRDTNCMIRSGSSWRTGAILCATAFVVAGVAVHRAGPSPAEPASRYTAEAAIVCPRGYGEALAPEDHGQPSAPLAAGLRQQLLSDERISRALRGQGPQPAEAAGDHVPAETIERVRRNVDVTVTHASSPDRIRIAIAHTDHDAGRAVRVVNALAASYAEEQSAKLKSAACRECLCAQETTHRARERFFQAKSRLDDFLGVHFSRLKALAAQGAQARPVSSPPVTSQRPPDASERPRTGAANDSPRVRLARQLKELERQRAELLVERTSQHPAVCQVESEIARVKQQLASIHEPPSEENRREEDGLGRPSYKLPGDRPAYSPPSGQKRDPLQENLSDGLSDGRVELLPGQTVGEVFDGRSGPTHVAPSQSPSDRRVDPLGVLKDAVREFRTFQEQVEAAKQQYDRLDEAERRAGKKRWDLPEIVIELAPPFRPSQIVGRWSPRWLVALWTAMAAATGVGLIFSGGRTDLPLVTPEQVDASVQVPVVGEIPADGPSTAEGGPGPSAVARRRAKVFFGMLLVAFCLVCLFVTL